MILADRDRLEAHLRCYLVTDPRVPNVERLTAICRSAVAGGVTAVQLRVKGWTDRKTLAAALALRSLCDEFGAMFIVNDRVDVALASRADGIHLGVDDLPVWVARELLGESAVIGYSPESDRDRGEAEEAGASYLGVGPVYGTTTKDDAGPQLGLERFREIVDGAGVPVIGIGGIDPTNAGQVIAAGAVGVAVVGAIFFADDPGGAAREIVAACDGPASAVSEAQA